MTVEEFTSEKATGQLEASLTLHLGNEGHPEVMISLYRYNGSSCLAAIDGKSVAYVLRSEVVELMEAVRAIVYVTFSSVASMLFTSPKSPGEIS